MSTDSYVVGLVPADERYKMMVKIFEACKDANVLAPDEVEIYFENLAGGVPRPDSSGMMVADIGMAVSDYRGKFESGYEVDLSKVPQNVTVIRFFNS